MMFRTKEEAKKELQEKILILDSNYKLAVIRYKVEGTSHKVQGAMH